MLAIINTYIDDPDDKSYMIWLYEEFHRLMFSTARKYTSNQTDCEDIVQNALVGLMQKISKLRQFDRCILTAYIVSIVRNAAINYLRQQALECEHSDSLDEDIPSLEDLSLIVSQRNLLSEVWSQLSQEDRFLLEGRYIIGASDKELASTLNCKSDSIRMKLTRARRRAFALVMKFEEGAL